MSASIRNQLRVSSYNETPEYSPRVSVETVWKQPSEPAPQLEWVSEICKGDRRGYLHPQCHSMRQIAHRS